MTKIGPVKPKEKYALVFKTAFQADYWLMTTHVELYSQIIYRNRNKRIIEFDDSIYYFVSEQQVNKIKGMRFDYVYPAEAIYIILDDPERLRITEGD